MKQLQLKSIVKLDNIYQLYNLEDILKYITGATNGHNLWAEHKMKALKDLQQKLGRIKEKEDGSFSFRITKEEAEILTFPLTESHYPIQRIFNDDVQKSFDKLFI
tara:strand:+ start:1851 stop:2165 length:315 start_codon:yes stop_codon:yes gene_type:complete